MRSILSALVIGSFFLGGTAFAQEEQPNKLLKVTKDIVNYLEPTPEIGYFISFKDIGDEDFNNAESFAGISGALYKFTSNDIELGSIRLGGQFEGDRKLYTTFGINGIGLAKRYLSDGTKASLSPGFVANIWDTVDKYGHLSAGIGLASVQDLFADGYTLEDHFGAVGTMGVTIHF